MKKLTQLQNQPELLTKTQVAELLQVSPRTVDNLLRKRRLPVVRFGPRLIRFPRQAVVARLNELTVQCR